MSMVLEDILASGEVTAPSGDRLPVHSHVSPEEGQYIQDMVRRVDPTTTLEIGLAYGISAMFICGALDKRPETRHIAIDPFQLQDFRDIGVTNVQASGHGDVFEIRRQLSHQALPQLETEGVRLDFAFIDAWHTFDHTLVDFFLVDRMLRVGGIVMIDDAQWPGVHKACRYIATNRPYSVVGHLTPEKRLPFAGVRRAIHGCARRSSAVRKLLRSEVALPDAALGLHPNSRCIAFRKDAMDERDCFEHHSF